MVQFFLALFSCQRVCSGFFFILLLVFIVTSQKENDLFSFYRITLSNLYRREIFLCLKKFLIDKRTNMSIYVIRWTNATSNKSIKTFTKFVIQTHFMVYPVCNVSIDFRRNRCKKKPNDVIGSKNSCIWCSVCVNDCLQIKY